MALYNRKLLEDIARNFYIVGNGRNCNFSTDVVAVHDADIRSAEEGTCEGVDAWKDIGKIYSWFNAGVSPWDGEYVYSKPWVSYVTIVSEEKLVISVYRRIEEYGDDGDVKFGKIDTLDISVPVNHESVCRRLAKTLAIYCWGID